VRSRTPDPHSAPEPDDRARLRVTFEAPNLTITDSLESQLRDVTDVPTQIWPFDRLAAGAPVLAQARAWYVEALLEPMPVSAVAVQMLERRMLSLEYRQPGARFLGVTTEAIPGIGERRSEPREGAAGRQRRYVEESLLRCPRGGAD
jgi:hypothetical protein